MPFALPAGVDAVDLIAAAREGRGVDYLLAARAADFCLREVRHTLHAMDTGAEVLAPLGSAQRLAQWQLQLLCARLAEGRDDRSAYLALIDEGLKAGDARLVLAQRLERLSAGWNAGGSLDEGERVQAIDAALASGDAAVWRALAAELAVVASEARFFVGGEAVAPGEVPDLLDALRLAVCEKGAPCEAEDAFARLHACASVGECDAQRALAHPASLAWLTRVKAILSGRLAFRVAPSAA